MGKRTTFWVSKNGDTADLRRYFNNIGKELRRKEITPTDPGRRMEKETCFAFIRAIITPEAGITRVVFDDRTGAVIIVARHPGHVIGRLGNTQRRIREETGWRPYGSYPHPPDPRNMALLRARFRAEEKMRRWAAKTPMNPCSACGKPTPFLGERHHPKYGGKPFCARCQAREKGVPFVTNTIEFRPQVRYKGRLLPDNIKLAYFAHLVEAWHPITREKDWKPSVGEMDELTRQLRDIRKQIQDQKGRGEEVTALEATMHGIMAKQITVTQKFETILARWLKGLHPSVASERLNKLRGLITRDLPIPLVVVHDILLIDRRTFKKVVLPRAKELGSRVGGGQIRINDQNAGALLGELNQLFMIMEQAEGEKR